MKFGFIVNPSKNKYFQGIAELADWLIDRENTVLVEDQPELPELGGTRTQSREELGRESDIVAVFGGDGTLLDASHEMIRFDTPILGVNTGGLGFLTETTMEEVRSSFERILSEDHEVHRRMMLEASVPGHDGALLGLNDMVLSRFRLGRVFQVAAYVDDSFVTSYVCDGMILSTPTGSTAYNLSASGPIVQPEVESIILNPICPHTLTNRPLIVPPTSSVRLSIESDDRCILTADGQDKITDLGEGDEIDVWKADQKVTLISSDERDFYNILRTKLHWSGRAPEDRGETL